MKLARLAALALVLASCPHPPPNPGQVVVTCAMDAVHDPAVVRAVLDALLEPDFKAKIAGIIAQVPGVTGEVVACILRQYLGQLAADPGKAQQYTRARSYLRDHGYEVP